MSVPETELKWHQALVTAGLMAGGKNHHCPKKSRGNCRHHGKLHYCLQHQQYCATHGRKSLKGEPCTSCYDGCDKHDELCPRAHGCSRCKEETVLVMDPNKYPQKKNDGDCRWIKTEAFCAHHLWKCWSHERVLDATQSCPSCG